MKRSETRSAFFIGNLHQIIMGLTFMRLIIFFSNINLHFCVGN